MQRLLAFLETNLHLLLFVALQLVCMYLLFSLNPYQKAYFSNTTAAITASVNQTSDNVSDYFNLAQENEKLQDDFANEFQSSAKAQLQFLGSTVTLKDSSLENMFSALPAQVVFNTIHKSENVFIINRGKKDGITKNMGVVSSQGIAGQVLAANENFSVVMSVLNTNLRLTPQINNQEYYSTIKWINEMPNEMAIEGINKLEKIEIGDMVTTGKSSLLFPAGIPIGYISKLDEKTNSQYYNTRFKTATDFRNLEYVFVIKNKYKNEIEELIPID